MVDPPRSDVPQRTVEQPGDTRPRSPAGHVAPDSGYSTWTEENLSGWAVFSGFVFGLLGLFQVIFGILALAGSDYFTAPTRALAVHVGYTGWGWIHLILGLVMLAAGGGLAFGNTAARVVGVGLAGISAVVNLAFLPAAPFAATLIIALDVFLIYAILVRIGARGQGR